MEIKYSAQNSISIHKLEQVPLEIFEKHAIFDFLQSIPVDALKTLVNFKKIDPTDNKLWDNSIEGKDTHLYELLKKLHNERQILLTCEMLIEDGK